MLAVEHFLPTIDRARQEGHLPDHLAVARITKLAALLVIADLMRRETWRETRPLDAIARAELPTQPPPFAAGQYRLWAVAQAPKGGTLVEHVTDRAVHLRDVFIPRALMDTPELFGLESAVEALVPVEPDPSLECKDLRKTGATAAYRGALAADQQPTFHEHDFADTIDRARAWIVDLGRARGRVVGANIRAFAWPLLHVQFQSDDPKTQLVLVPDQSGVLHALTGAELEEREEARPLG